MRRAARIDSNQPEIVAALRKAGALVAVTSSLGGGFPDIVVGFRKRIFLVEIKDGSKPPSAQALTGPEKTFHKLWAGYVHVINSETAALNMIGLAPHRGYVS